MEKTEREDSDSQPKPTKFTCHICDLSARYDYYGRRPLERHYSIEMSHQSMSETTKEKQKHSRKHESIELIENCYVCDDPFDGHNRASYLVLGSNCNVCNKMVCVGTQCSFFYYTKRFCFVCASSEEKVGRHGEFPAEINNEIDKYIQSVKDI